MKRIFLIALVFSVAVSLEVSYYDILGIQKNSTQSDIKKAFKKLAMDYHPDNGRKKSEIKDQTFQNFSEIVNAYETLKDPNQRQEYDYDQFGEVGQNGQWHYYGQQEDDNQNQDEFEFDVDPKDIHEEVDENGEIIYVYYPSDEDMKRMEHENYETNEYIIQDEYDIYDQDMVYQRGSKGSCGCGCGH